MTKRRDGAEKRKAPPRPRLENDCERQDLFLARVAIHGNVALACREVDGPDAHATASSFRQLALRDPTGFGLKLEHAKELYKARILKEIQRRALEGVDKARTYKGDVIGYDREYSDGLLETLARAHLSEFTPRSQLDVNVHHAEPGIWQITASMLQLLPPDLKAKLIDVVRWISDHNRKLAQDGRETQRLIARNDEAIEAEYEEAPGDDDELKAWRQLEGISV